MKLFRYWAREAHRETDHRGKPMELSCWRWSNVSLDDARKRAQQAARAAVAKLLSGEPVDRYGYADRPVREEIIAQIAGTESQREPEGIITRNCYGALILNTSRVMFIDVDVVPARKGILGGLFGKKNRPDPFDEAIDRIHDAAQSLNGCSIRIYQTAAGLRCLITNQVFDPTSDATTAILQRFGSDPLYARLCKAQECFRARLTPKPWRCRIEHPPGRYPFRNAEHEARYRAWEEKYQNAISAYSTCRLRDTIGDGSVHEDLATLIEEHDMHACFDESLPLA